MNKMKFKYNGENYTLIDGYWHDSRNIKTCYTLARKINNEYELKCNKKNIEYMENDIKFVFPYYPKRYPNHDKRFIELKNRNVKSIEFFTIL